MVLPVTISSSVAWEGVDTEIHGSEVEVYTDQEVWQDDPDWTNYGYFEEQLSTGGTVVPIIVEDITKLIVHIWGHSDAPDLDLGARYTTR